MTRSPDFLCVGAQKAATSWLFVMLRSVEGVFLPAIKESNYLIERAQTDGGWARGYRLSQVEQERAFYAMGGPVVRPTSAIMAQLDHLGAEHVSDDWYREVFSFAREGAVTGEICPSYMNIPMSGIHRAMGINPDLRVLLIIRDPIDRLWSQLRMEMRYGLVGRDLDSLLADRAAMQHYLDFTDYSGSIERWSSCTGGLRLCLVLYDHICADPGGVLEEVIGFIGAPGLGRRVLGRPGGLDVRVNQGQAERLSSRHRSRLLGLLGDQYAYLGRLYPDAVGRWMARHLEAISRAA